jgi:chromosome segregation ATPase
MFETIMSSLREVKETMATKEFVNAKFDTYNERMGRLESDLKKWELESSKSQSNLRQELLNNIRDHKQDNTEEHADLHTRINEIEAAKLELDKHKRSRTLAITLSMVGAGLSLLVSIISAVVINSLIP